VIVAAIGAWSGAPPTGPYPTGHTARALLEHADKPVVVVPPATGSRGVIRRILLPLEGTEGSSRPVLERLLPLLVDQVELVVLHVFTDATVPAMLDRPEYDMDILGREFLSRHFPHANSVELRAGSVVEQVARMAADQHVDLIILSWSQSPSPERAGVVRGVLDSSALPVLLLPVQSPGDASADGHAVGSEGPGMGRSRSEGSSGSATTQ
jgi:nucleotide-binding universal stress UspA family protein